MNLKFLGSKYGGWEIDIDSVVDGDTIIDAGLGEDVSFLIELKKLKNISIIGIDPTKKSHDFLLTQDIGDFELLKKAIHKHGVDKTSIYKNSNTQHVSESVFPEHQSVSANSYIVDCVSFNSIISTYTPSLVKMDIEGIEYEVIKECIGVRQICVEFHHHCITNKSLNDTMEIIALLEESGYVVISNRNNIEVTFLKK